MKNTRPKRQYWRKLKTFGKKISEKIQKIGKTTRHICSKHFPERIWTKTQSKNSGHQRF
jgi:hypothetical protein